MIFYERLFKWIFIVSILLMLGTYFHKDGFPNPEFYIMNLLKTPIQSPTSREPFTVHMNDQTYKITPKFDYELWGVVVTYNNSNGLTDIWHYDHWKDFINIRDLCVIWGTNVGSGIYKKIDFSSDSWTCWVSWNDSNTTRIFKFNELSNNHILTANSLTKSALESAEVGDLIHFKGILAEYRNDSIGFFRGTSITRDDTGQHACETVYIDNFEVIQKANPFLRNMYYLSKWTAIISFILYAIMFFNTPHKTRG